MPAACRSATSIMPTATGTPERLRDVFGRGERLAGEHGEDEHVQVSQAVGSSWRVGPGAVSGRGPRGLEAVSTYCIEPWLAVGRRCRPLGRGS